jgi:aspartate/methionine/tyrosine aminotransferase
MQAVADRFGVPDRCVVMPGGGCSFSNHLALAALVAPGDEVVIEEPTYELLETTLGFFQASLRRFSRRPEDAWRLDPARAIEAITPRTRLVVLTNLHNPSSALAPDEAVLEVAAAAERVGARVLVDEVYRELTFTDGTARTVFRPEANIVVTSSLTKAYGLSGLRCGWILAPADLSRRLSRLNDLFGVHPPHVAERMALHALSRLGPLRARANRMIQANRTAYRGLLGDHPKLQQSVFDHGTTVFPRLVEGDVDALHRTLQETYETSLAPGRFFGMPRHLRIGLGGDPEATRVGLERLAEALC